MRQGGLFQDEHEGEPQAPDEFPDLSGVGELGFDTETTGLRWWGLDRPVGLSVAWRDSAGRLLSRYLPWAHRGGGNHPEPQVRAWVRDQLRGKKLRGLNVPFDANQMRAWGVNLEADLGCTFNDVAHNEALLDDSLQPGQFGLEAIAQKRLGEGKVGGINPEDIADMPAWRVAPYARQDAELVVRVHETQRPLMDADELDRVSALEDDVIPATAEMMWNGARIDVDKLERWEAESERELTTLLFKLHAAAGFHVSPSSPTDLGRLMASIGAKSDECTCPDPKKHREVCTPSYADSVLARLEPHFPQLKALRDAAHLEDLRSKYLVPYLRDVGPDGILRFSLNQLRGEWGGTVSGRFSSSQPIRGEGINVQQVMSNEKHKKLHGDRYGVRELFIPAPGLILFGSDAKQIEYRIFAHMANSRAILDVYDRDPEADFHQVVCDMVKAFRSGFSRKDSKNLNFAILFGAGIKKVAEMLGVDIKTARMLRDAYFEAFPEARQLMDLAQELAKERGWIKTMLGRRARFKPCPRHGYAGSKEPCGTCPRLHKALNSAVQGSAADLNKLKLVELYRERRALSLTMRMTIHDEFVGDIPSVEHGARVAALLDRQSLPMRVPILWDSRTAANWAAAK